MRTKQSIESWLKSKSLIFKTNLTAVVVLTMMFGSLSVAQADGPDNPQPVQRTESVHQMQEQFLSQFGFQQTAPQEKFNELDGTVAPDNSTIEEKLVRKSKPALVEEQYSATNNGSPPVPTKEAEAALLAQMANDRLAWPMRRGFVSSRFGMRWGRLHSGTDIAAPYGSPIYAAAGGKVVYSGWRGGYGNLIEIEHSDGTHTRYGHCSKISTSVGKIVKQGELIGNVGSTGHSTGPHLHFEVLRNGVAQNPEAFVNRIR